MSGQEAWIRALYGRPRAEEAFTLSFSRLELGAECRSLSAADIGAALALPGEAAARRLLYLSCPSLRQAGETLAARGQLDRPEDITLALPYSDVLGAADLILAQSGGGEARVQLARPAAPAGLSSEKAAAEEELDGYALLQKWAAQARSREASVPASTEQTGGLAATLGLRQSWQPAGPAGGSRTEATNSAPAMAEQVARELCSRLCDAAGNM